MSFMMAVFCTLCFAFWAQGVIYQDNVADFRKCKTHISRAEGKYREFYEIERSEKAANDSLVFDFHFSVLARSDAHLLLAESDVLKKTDPVYEIVIGAGGNTFSDLRRMQKSGGKVTARIKDLLSAIEVRSFWVHVWNDGLVEVGKETEELAFLAWTDPEPINLKFFSFSTWPGVEAMWYFDCERSITKKSELVLTNTEKLREDMFGSYNVFVRPVLNETTTTDVELNLTPQYVSLDEASSQLSIKGTGNMKWIDEKLTWNPEDYGGIKLQRLPCSRLWTPDLRLYDNQVHLQDAILQQNGSISCNILLDVTYWCNIENLGAWPSDIHNCNLSFGFMKDADKIKLNFVSNRENFFKLPSASQWTVVNVDVQDETTNETLNDFEDASPVIVFKLTLRRTSSIYKLIFLTPFFVISVCSLCTFWVSPFGHLKITLCCLQLIMESIILIYISTIIPGHSTTVPGLVTLYSGSLVGTVILVIISIIVINLSRSEGEKHSINTCLYYFLSSHILQSILFLNTNNNDGNYGKLRESLTKRRENSEKSMWFLLGAVIDRVAFVIYCVLCIFAISQKY